MKVKELIAQLKNQDPEIEVVIDLIEGFFSVEEFVVEGGTGHPNYQTVAVISLEEKI